MRKYNFQKLKINFFKKLGRMTFKFMIKEYKKNNKKGFFFIKTKKS